MVHAAIDEAVPVLRERWPAIKVIAAALGSGLVLIGADVECALGGSGLMIDAQALATISPMVIAPQATHDVQLLSLWLHARPTDSSSRYLAV